jgi:hypothetical protein
MRGRVEEAAAEALLGDYLPTLDDYFAFRSEA